jgi:hypothetical protein
MIGYYYLIDMTAKDKRSVEAIIARWILEQERLKKT